MLREFSWCRGESRGRGQERGKKRSAPCKSVGKRERAALGGGGRVEREGLERRNWRGLGQLQAVVLQHWNREQAPTKCVLEFLSELNWEAPAWRACAGLGSADEGGWVGESSHGFVSCRKHSKVCIIQRGARAVDKYVMLKLANPGGNKAGFATVVVLMFLFIEVLVSGKERLKSGKPPQLIVSIYHSWAGLTWFSVEASF